MIDRTPESARRTWRPMLLWSAAIVATLLAIWMGTWGYIAYREADAVMHEIAFDRVKFEGYSDEAISPAEGVERLGGAAAAARKVLLWQRLRGISSNSRDWSRGGEACWSAAVREMLAHCGRAGIPFLLSETTSQHPEVRRDAISRLGQIGEPTSAVVAALMRTLHDDDSWSRANAARALGKLGAASAGPELAKLLDDPEEYVRFSAQQALRELQLTGNEQGRP